MSTIKRRLTIRTANGEMHLLTGEIYQVLADKFKRTDVYQSCITCVHFDPASENCKKYQQRPPAHIIADGCESYEDTNDIPF